MQSKNIVAIVWPKGEAFTFLYDTILMASATHKILWIVDEDINTATLRGEITQEVLSSFEQDPKLSLIYGDEANFVFVESKSLLSVLDILRLNPPHDFRDLIRFFRDSRFCKELYETKRFPLSFGKLLGSESLRRATDRQRFEERRQKENQLRIIIEKLYSDDPKKAECILKELGQAVIREIRSSDDFDWQLNWIIKRLEKEGYKKRDLLGA